MISVEDASFATMEPGDYLMYLEGKTNFVVYHGSYVGVKPPTTDSLAMH